MKSICSNSFINLPISFFRERLFPLLSTLLAKIKAIAMAAFALIADCFGRSRSTGIQQVTKSNSIPRINGVGGRSLHHHNLNLEHSDNQSNSSMEESAAIPDHSNSSLLNINEEVEEGSRYSSTHIPGGQPSTSIEEASDESMSIAMINLNAWVRAGAPNEQRQTAEKQIMAHLNRSQNIWCTLSGLKLSTLPNIFYLSAFRDRLNTLDLRDNKLTMLSPEIGQCIRLKTLWLGGNQLTTLPPEIGQCTQLESLLLYRNQLTTLPSEIGQLKQLKELELSNNQITTLPSEIGQLKQLKELELSNNQITTLPAEIGQCTQLKKLVLFSNPLRSLPPEIGQCTQLEELSFCSSRLTILPSEIGQLEQLKMLHIPHNRITTLPSGIGQCTQLKHLYLLGNRLTILPSGIGQCTQLQILSLAVNQLRTLPSEIGQCVQLKQLQISSNQLSELPPEIWQCTKLKELNLGENRLTTLPSEIGQCTQLEKLQLYRNQLSALPPEIGLCTQLEELDLSQNRLTTLPSEIGQCTQLEKLKLSRNQLSALPPEIGLCTQLEELDLSWNQLTTLPPEIGQLVQLCTVRLSNNPLVGLPIEVMNFPQSCTIEIENCHFTRAVLENLRSRTQAPGYTGPRFSFSMSYANPQAGDGLSLEVLLQNLFLKVNEPYISMTNILGEDLPQTSLQLWLSRLSFISDYNSTPERKRWLIQRIIQYLKLANENELFRTQLFSIIDGAAATCGDRIALSILHLGIAYRLMTIDRREMQQLADFLAKGVWTMSILETFARNKVVTLPFFDEIEVYLAYPIQLKERLQLPIDVEEMLYFRMSGVTSSDLDEAYSFVTAKLADQEAFYNFLVEEPAWTGALKINYPDEYASIEIEKRGQLDNTTDPEKYHQIEQAFRTKVFNLTARALSEPNRVATSSTT